MKVKKLSTGMLLAGFLLTGSIAANAQKVTFHGEQVSLKQAFEKIEGLSKYKIVYNTTRLDVKKQVVLNQKNKEVLLVINDLLQGTGYTYKVENNYVVIVPQQKQGKKVKIHGTVKDENESPIIGANVTLKGVKGQGTVTDVDGKFSLDVPAGSTLIISYIGYATRDIKVGDKTLLDITLHENSKQMDEVVVIGYGSRSKKDVTTSISAISSEKIASKVAVSPELAMQGQMSGVQVIGNQGDPNARPTIRIRGINTWGVASPLYVIDGIPVKEYGAGVEDDAYSRGSMNIMSMIDPSDIESISVLKDAASAAIYGLRAANGVILITTKSGKRERTRVEYNQRIGVQDQWQRVDNLMNTKQYADFYRLVSYTNPEWESTQQPENKYVFNPTSNQYLGNNPTYDWQTASLTDTPLTQDYSVRVSGGGEKSDYSVSFSYADYDGVSVGSKMKRYSGSMQINSDINKYIRVGVNSRIAYGQGNGAYGPNLIEAASIAPWQPIYDSNGVHGYAGVVAGYDENGNWSNDKLYGQATGSNFLGSMASSYSKSSSLRFMGNAYLEIEPIKNLKLKGTVSLDNFTNKQFDFVEGAGTIFASNGGNPTSNLPTGSVGTYQERGIMNTNLIFEFTASYKFSIQKKHNFDLLFNIMGQKYYAKFNDGSTKYVTSTNPNLHVLGGDNEYTNVGTFMRREALAGSLYRLSYNYNHKYYLDATVRRDGSIRFAPENRWGVFPGVSAAWRISAENFLKDIRWIDDIKLRASWGQLGNQEVESMAYLSSINEAPIYTWGDNPAKVGCGYFSSGAAVYGMANRGLEWEKTTTTNVGVDFTFFQGLTGSIEYYYKKTDGILQKTTLPISSGVLSPPSDNLGSVKNTGIELNLSYNKQIGDFGFSVGGNFTTVRNRVVKMYGGTPINLDKSSGVIEEGRPMNYLRGYVPGGIFQSQAEVDEYIARVNDVSYNKQFVTAGDYWFKDLNGAPLSETEAYSVGPDGKVDAYDMTMIGKTIPGYFYGFNLGADWKGIDFSAQFTGVGDVQKFNVVRQRFWQTGGYAAGRHQLDVLNYWRPDNTNTVIPRLDALSSAGNSRQAWLEDADYLRLANLQIGYTLPDCVYRATKNILRNARIYVGIQNLFTITKYNGLDPEDDNTPAPRVYYTGLSLTF